MESLPCVRVCVCAAVLCEKRLLPIISGADIMISGVLYVPQQLSTGLLGYETAVVYQCNRAGSKFEDGYSSHAVVCNEYGMWTVPQTAITCSGQSIKMSRDGRVTDVTTHIAMTSLC